MLTKEQYEIERAICDKAQEYWEAHASYDRSGASSMSAELAAHPDYAACDNAMRGRVEQYEILTQQPAVISAYIGKRCEPDKLNGWAIPRWEVTTFVGDVLGYAHITSVVKALSVWGGERNSYRAKIGRRLYHGRSYGEGMLIVLRETAQSKRANPRNA